MNVISCEIVIISDNLIVLTYPFMLDLFHAFYVHVPKYGLSWPARYLKNKKNYLAGYCEKKKKILLYEMNTVCHYHMQSA